MDPAATAQAARPHDNVLRPWRERVADLTEQLERMGAESVDQRAVWGQQIVGLREQFTQARTLLEVGCLTVLLEVGYLDVQVIEPAHCSHQHRNNALCLPSPADVFWALMATCVRPRLHQ